MLRIPRPRTIAECAEEARPCPWASCRHHLLFELATAKPRTHGPAMPTAMRLNGLGHQQRKGGRHPGLRSSAAAAIVRSWIEDAVERLSGELEYTCTFDFVRDYPDGAPPSRIAEVLGVAEQLIDRESRAAAHAYRAKLEALQEAEERAYEHALRESLGIGSGLVR